MSARILFVDDDPDAIEVYEEYFEELEVPIDTSAKPEEALELANTYPYELVVTDFMMPGMNGIEFISRIRDNPENHGTQFFILSGYVEESKVQEFKKLGISEVLIKPVSFETLFKKVEMVFQKGTQLSEEQMQLHKDVEANLQKTFKGWFPDLKFKAHTDVATQHNLQSKAIHCPIRGKNLSGMVSLFANSAFYKLLEKLGKEPSIAARFYDAVVKCFKKKDIQVLTPYNLALGSESKFSHHTSRRAERLECQLGKAAATLVIVFY